MMRFRHRAVRGLRSVEAALVCAFVVFGAWHPPAHAQRVGSAVGPPALKEGSAAQSALKLDYSGTPVALQVALPAAGAAVKQSIAQKDSDLPLQIGVHRPMPNEFQGDVSPKLDWEAMDDGSIVSSMSVTSSGASAMRMGVKAELPDGAELRFFDGQSNQGPGYPVIGPTDLVLKNGTPANARGVRRGPRNGRSRERAVRPGVFPEGRRCRESCGRRSSRATPSGWRSPCRRRMHCPRSR